MRKLGIFSLGFAAACFASQYLLPANILLWFVGGALILSIASALLLRGDWRIRAAVFLSGAAVSFGLSYAHYLTHDVKAAAQDGREEIITARAEAYTEATDWGCRVLVRTDGLKAYLYLQDDVDIAPGDEITLRAKLSLPRKEIRDYYNSKGVYLTAVQKSEPVYSRPAKVPMRYWPAVVFNSLKRSIASGFSPDVSGLVNAVVTGDDSGLEESLVSAISSTGLTHVVVVSGMHFSYLLAFLYLLTGKNPRRRLIALPILLFFMAVTGFTPSVMRAGIIAIILLPAPVLKREYDPLTGLGLSLIIMLGINPKAALSISLQLSYASFLGLLLFSPRIYSAFRQRLHSKLRILDRILKYVCSSAAATLGAMALTVPLTAVYFGRVSVLAPLANLVTLPVVVFIFIGGVIVGALGIFLPLAASALSFIVWPFARYFDWMATLLSRTQAISFSTGNPFLLYWLVFAYAIILLMLLAPRPGKKFYIPLACLAVSFCAACCAGLMLYSDTLSLVISDVGQGSCAVLSSGSCSAVFDCGGSKAADKAQNALSALGKTSLDALVLTHLHADHAGGAASLISCMKVDALYLPMTADRDGLLGGILQKAREYGTRVIYVTEDMTLELGNTRVRLVAPLGREDNEAGLAAIITRDDFDALITGDMGSETEIRLASRYELPKTEVFIVSHHGSKNGSCKMLLDEIKPDIAVISVGEGNTYGHPSGEAVSRLKSAGAEIYRTDLNGSISITLN
ncbi:MAG: ComEC/Rec2 family competence protein [Oscillospiraceae bacterium]|jgi:competence protein ComEC